MPEDSNAAKSLRDRLGASGEDRLGRALGELLESPLLHGAIGRAFDAREKAAQAQEVALGALNIPSAADVERLTRRLRAVSHRLEAIEDTLAGLDEEFARGAVDVRLRGIETRLAGIEEQLTALVRQGEQRPPARRAGEDTDAKVAHAAKAARKPAARKAAKRAG
jgi:anti-sigma-K factor RskA